MLLNNYKVTYSMHMMASTSLFNEKYCIFLISDESYMNNFTFNKNSKVTIK